MQNDGKNRKFKLQKVEGTTYLRMVIKKIDKSVNKNIRYRAG